MFSKIFSIIAGIFLTIGNAIMPVQSPNQNPVDNIVVQKGNIVSQSSSTPKTTEEIKKGSSQPSIVKKQTDKINENTYQIDSLGDQIKVLQQKIDKLQPKEDVLEKNSVGSITNYNVQNTIDKNLQLQNCLNSHYTKETLISATEKALYALNDSAEKNRQKVRDSYGGQIESVRVDGESKLTSAREAQRGFATNSAYLTQIQKETDASVKDLELRRDELLSMIDIDLAEKTSGVYSKQLELEAGTAEAVCY